jgi:hypothetical protein
MQSTDSKRHARGVFEKRGVGDRLGAALAGG